VTTAKQNYILALILVLVSASFLTLVDSLENADRVTFNTSKIKTSKALGTPERVEREFKIGFVVTNAAKFNDQTLPQIQNHLYHALRKNLSEEDWASPAVIGNPYNVERNPSFFMTRDLYFDTRDKLAHKHAISYRLRHRFQNTRQLFNHEENQFLPRFFPYRGEIQAKTGRVERGSG
jgi:hypothetical protein